MDDLCDIPLHPLNVNSVLEALEARLRKGVHGDPPLTAGIEVFGGQSALKQLAVGENTQRDFVIDSQHGLKKVRKMGIEQRFPGTDADYPLIPAQSQKIRDFINYFRRHLNIAVDVIPRHAFFAKGVASVG